MMKSSSCLANTMSDRTKEIMSWHLHRGYYSCAGCYVDTGVIPNVLDQACRHKQRERRRRLAAEANGEVYVPTAMEADPLATANNKRAAETMAGANGAGKRRRKTKVAKRTHELIK